MPALTKDTTRTYEIGDINEIPMAGGAVIFQGGAIGATLTGYARALQLGDTLLGFAEDHAENSGSDGARTIRVRKKGAVLLEIPGVTLMHINKSVYALNDNTFTLVPINAVYIGRISRIESSGVALVEFASYTIPPVVV